jgi:hypothetical protein
MREAIEAFEVDFAHWDLHIPEDAVEAKRGGQIREAGWSLRYNFGRDARGEYLDYYAVGRDVQDDPPADDLHVRIYEGGERVALPTVLEAYMYGRDPTWEELERARHQYEERLESAATPALDRVPETPTVRPTPRPRMATGRTPGSVPPAGAPIDADPTPHGSTTDVGVVGLPPLDAPDAYIAIDIGLDLDLDLDAGQVPPENNAAPPQSEVSAVASNAEADAIDVISITSSAEPDAAEVSEVDSSEVDSGEVDSSVKAGAIDDVVSPMIEMEADEPLLDPNTLDLTGDWTVDGIASSPAPAKQPPTFGFEPTSLAPLDIGPGADGPSEAVGSMPGLDEVGDGGLVLLDPTSTAPETGADNAPLKDAKDTKGPTPPAKVAGATGGGDSAAPASTPPTPPRVSPSSQPPAEAVAGLARFGIGGTPPPRRDPPRGPRPRPVAGAGGASAAGAQQGKGAVIAGGKAQPPSRSSKTAPHRDDIGPDNTLVDVEPVGGDISAEADAFKPWWLRSGGRRKMLIVAAIIVGLLSAGLVVAHLLHWPPTSEANPDAVDPSALLGSPGASEGGVASDSQTRADSQAANSSGGTDSTVGAKNNAAPDDSRSAATTPPATSSTPAPAADDGMARPAGPNSVAPIQPTRRPPSQRSQP